MSPRAWSVGIESDFLPAFLHLARVSWVDCMEEILLML